MTPALELRSISCSYHSAGLRIGSRPRAVVRDVSLAVRPGEVLGIVGESGSGKTTLTRAMLGLLRPLTGEVLLEGRPHRTLKRLERARLLQAVFQDPFSSLNPNRRIIEIVAQPLDIHSEGTHAQRRDRAVELCRLVGLAQEHLHRTPRQLSGGQRQRVAIAQSLALRPRVLVCDEPTSALDVSVQAQILNLLLDLQLELGLAIVFVSHNLAVVEHLATHVAVLSQGEVVETGPAADLIRSPQHPYTRTLLDSILRVDALHALSESLSSATSKRDHAHYLD